MAATDFRRHAYERGKPWQVRKQSCHGFQSHRKSKGSWGNGGHQAHKCSCLLEGTPVNKPNIQVLLDLSLTKELEA
jgi:hypothetical protein